MVPQYAILIDGNFVVERVLREKDFFPTKNGILKLINQLEQNKYIADHDLLRVYFYHSTPATGKIQEKNPVDGSNPDLSKAENSSKHVKLIQGLETSPNISVRLGETVARDWVLKKSGKEKIKQHYIKKKAGDGSTSIEFEPSDFKPNLHQKGVDLRIGLDIARFSLNKTVRNIVVVTGDSDMIPAFKFARREGVRVILDDMKHPNINRELRVHADICISSNPAGFAS